MSYIAQADFGLVVMDDISRLVIYFLVRLAKTLMRSSIWFNNMFGSVFSAFVLMSMKHTFAPSHSWGAREALKSLIYKALEVFISRLGPSWLKV